MPKQITVKKIEHLNTKMGRQYIKIQDINNKYYNFFGDTSSITESIKPGAEMSIEIETTKDGRFTNIKRIISVFPEGASKPEIVEGRETKTETYDVDAEMQKSKEAMEKLFENYDPSIINLGYLIATHSDQKFKLWQGKKIQEMELKKIKAYGRVE